MKLTVNRLAITTVLAFLFSPLISVIPGILLLISTEFLWLSQQAFSETDDINDTNDYTEEDETEVIDRGDHVVIIEKKVINKKDISYSDAVKYNIKNTNCIGDCKSFEAPSTKNHYKSGHKHCLICKKWLVTKEINCPCCSSLMRTKTNI